MNSSMYQPSGHSSPNLLFLWPAFAAAAASEFSAEAAKQFANLAAGLDCASAREPKWATEHTIAVELKTVRLRDFSTETTSPATLLCAPFALHGASICDFAPGHSLVATLRGAGLRRLFVTDWRTATTDMRLLGIDQYLADVNVLVDEIGGPVDLIGLCQGGWMALVYAARFPAKVRSLVLAGAPVDIQAAPSALSELAHATPLPVFQELVRIGDGIVPGAKVMKFWGTEAVEADDARRVLQTKETIGSTAFHALEAQFRAWYAWTVDLPGNFFLEVVDKLYKRNELANGSFAALGRGIDLGTIRVPVFLLAAQDDELISPPQLFAAERLVGTAPSKLRKLVVPGRHVGLFMGKTVLEKAWPKIVQFITESQHNAAPLP